MKPGRRIALLAAMVAFAAFAFGCEDAAVPTENPFQCIGLSNEKCESLLAEAQRSVPNSLPVSAVIRCSGVCTEEQGDATVQVLFANGERTEYGVGWASAQGGGVDPVPVPPVGPSPAAPLEPSAPPAS